MEEPGGLQSMGSLESGMTERLHFHFSLSCIGEGNGNPLQCSCLENPRDGGAWWAAVYGVAQSWTQLKRLSSSSSSSSSTVYHEKNARLDEAQAGIKIAGKNINNLRYVDDTTLMAESEEELMSLLKEKKESEKFGLKLNIQKMKVMTSDPITSWQIDGQKIETVTDFIFLVSNFLFLIFNRVHI